MDKKSERVVTLKLDAPYKLSNARVKQLVGMLLDIGLADAAATRDNADLDERAKADAEEAWSLDIGPILVHRPRAAQ